MAEPRDERRKDCINTFKHLIAGIVCDAVSNRDRQGGDLAIFLRSAMTRIDAEIGRIFDFAVPPPKAEVGTPATIPIKRAAT